MIAQVLAALVLPQTINLDAFVTDAMPRYNVPGAAVGVIQDGKVITLAGYGYREHGKPATVDPDTAFQLASVTKTFTAALAGTFVDEGALGWDDPIINVLPEFVGYDPATTRVMSMRDLLAHRTGWPAFTGDLFDSLGYSRSEVLRRLRFFKPTFPLRQTATYSNVGYFTAGEVCAKAGKGSWNDLMRQRLLTPLGMTRTLTVAKEFGRGNSSKNHAMVNRQLTVIPHPEQDVLAAAGSLSGSVRDVSQFVAMLLNGGMHGGKRILKPETVNEILARSMVADVGFTEMPPISEDSGFAYGLGVGGYTYRDHHVVEKGGAQAGVRTLIVMVPKLKAGIVILSNMNVTAFPEAVRAFWLDKLLGVDPADHQKQILAANTQIQAMFSGEQGTARTGPSIPFSGDTKSLVGNYHGDLYGDVAVTIQGGRLFVEAGPARYRGELVHSNGGLFFIKWPALLAGPSATTFTIGEDWLAESMTNDDMGTLHRVRAER